MKYEAVNQEVNESILSDLTRNERRQLGGFEELKEDEAEKPMLVEVLGVGGTQALIAVMTDATLTVEQKTEILIKVFSFSEEDAKKMMNI